MLDRLGLGGLLDLPPFRQVEHPRPAARVLRVERIEAVGVEVADYVPDSILGSEGSVGQPGFLDYDPDEDSGSDCPDDPPRGPWPPAPMPAMINLGIGAQMPPQL
jgi:hypothetical protein